MAPSRKQLAEDLDQLSAELEGLTAANHDGLGFFKTRVNQLITDIVGSKDALAIRFNGQQWDAGSSVRRRLDRFGQTPGYVTPDDSYRFDKAKQATREVLQSLKWKLERQGAIGNEAEAAGPSPDEATIIAGLEAQAPNASPCYQQAIRDLEDPDRLSYRGTANELRAAVWEVLEALAPDDAVMTKPGFALEKGQTKPTHKQKARYILSARLGDTARQAAETSIDIIEEKVGNLVRNIYGRSSTSSHIETEKSEVRQIKRYVDTVLSELLEVSEP